MAIFGIMLFLPVSILISALIYLEDSSKKIFYLQNRIGLNKKTITVIKFRTMYIDRITKTGKWLRPTGLDELPQFINVIKGDMSMVGPRPLTKKDVYRLGWNSNFYSRRWSVLPGITGLAQLFGGINADHSWHLDKGYIDQQSFLLDMRIIVLSFAVTLFGKRRVKKFIKGNQK